MKYEQSVPIRWSDLDPNFHLRHSMYYDICASVRMQVMTQIGITPAILQQHNIGPILFREECQFRREICFGDVLVVGVKIDKLSRDFRKWSMQHELIINDTLLAATLTIDGAWMDTKARKIIPPPHFFIEAYDHIPRTEMFTWS